MVYLLPLMHVDLRLPPEWEVTIEDGLVRAKRGALEIIAAKFEIVPDRKREWAIQAMCRELGVAPDQLAFVVDEVGQTTDGWPTWFVVAKRATDGSERAFAFYHFLDYSTRAIVRGGESRAQLALLRNARPNYATDEVVAIEQLWE
jgi:hypothetical protein